MSKLSLAAMMLMAGQVYAEGQICNPSIAATTSTTQYQLVNNGTVVKDSKTGLFWQRCSVGQSFNGKNCTGEASLYTWQQAIEYAQKQGENWRVPTIDELKTLQEQACIGASINEVVFVDTPLHSETWSSTVEGADYAMMMSFYNGEVSSNDKLNSLYIRLVKSQP